ncbi:LytR C-terminal domain-containing protein [Noviherbaspirillum soli]|uniref:LytR C-terminal domain-containing protein n=1 Tax=Noviherbaspirillum soli TaxID=1064518 RepID=UPI00188C2EF3|nr:LytR C-terminal domain-containing protein [Noviherbaspirillum soli]
MPTTSPILAAVASVCLLQACATAPAPTEPRAMKMEPLLQVRGSGDQTAATYYQLGKFHQARGNREQARTAYLQSISLDRRQVEARNALAVLNSEDGKLDEARAMLEQLTRDYPRMAYLHNNLAYVHLLRGEPDAAIPSLERALALEPGNARALNNLGLVQTALLEKRDRLTAALGLADVIVEKAGGGADTATTTAAKPAEEAAAAALAAARQATSLVKPAPAMALPSKPAMPDVLAPNSRMEVVQVLPNVIELRQRQPAMAERREEKTQQAAAIESKTLAATPPQPRAFRFDVANGNGVPGMALKMRDALARRGIHAARVTNKRPFNTESTEIQYLAGFEKEAERVRAAMASHVAMKPVSVIAGTQDVRLVLGRDAAGHVALMGEAPLLAYSASRK